jgi:nicotinate-nucleotide adenylyltransferase
MTLRLGLALVALLAAAPAAARDRSGVAIFTGTFDPIHEGHLKVALAARDELGVDRVILLPRPPYGEKQPVSVADRAAMIRLAVAGTPGIEVADAATIRMLARAGDEAVISTIQARDPRRPVIRIHGTDSLLKTLEAGYLRENLARGIRYAVVPRAGYELPRRLPPGVTVLRPTPDTVSSTAIRRALAEGRAPRGLPTAVARYIRARGLYRPR